MSRESLKAFIAAGLELEQLRIAFFHRLVLLGIANLQGMDQRNQRLSSQYRESSGIQYQSIADIEKAIQIANEQSKILSDCGEACLKEARNMAQIVLLTQEELWLWNDQLISSWFKFVDSFTQLCKKHDQTRRPV